MFQRRQKVFTLANETYLRIAPNGALPAADARDECIDSRDVDENTTNVV